MNASELWDRYRRYLVYDESLGLRLDVSRMMFADDLFDRLAEPMERAFDAMDAIEAGAVANTDEGRRVGHYWLRDSSLAPDDDTRQAIGDTIAAVRMFVGKIRSGEIKPKQADGFYIALVVGIGGSALGPRLVADALEGDGAGLVPVFLDNTDPEGIDRLLGDLEESISETLTIVISKSGGTKETRNAMLEVAARYKGAGLSFAKHAVAVTGEGSALHRQATKEAWLATFPMWDWVGGRTSVTSAVGLVPAALAGVDVEGLLDGARACDRLTRNRVVRENPAAMLAAMWHYAGNGRGERAMVVLPYCDRLALFGRYLQQLVMESLGKRCDRAGNVVHQGLTVYGNKGSTDQHAYVQQLRDGKNDFFVTFVEVLRDRVGASMMVEADVTTGDYLDGFLHGTRAALYEQGRESMTITINELNARTLGALIALFERAVGLYAELINVNAYHQPGVEAGKTAAGDILDLQRSALAHLRENRGTELTADEIAAALGAPDAAERIHHLLEHASANEDHGIRRTAGDAPYRARYAAS